MHDKRLPNFKSADEAARFWDEHDFTDYQDEFEVEEVHYQAKRQILSVRFDPGDAIEISRAARQLGMDRSTFVRFVVKQYLGHSKNGQQAAASHG